MANKEFGIKEITLVGSSGSPTIQSPNNINLVANTVAISTNLTVGSDLTVTNNLTSNNITVSNLSITNVAGVTTIVNLDASTVNVSGVSTFAGITTVTGPSLFTKQLNVSGVSTFSGQSTFDSGIILNGNTSNLSGSQRILLSGGEGGDTQLYNGGTAFSSFIFNSMQGGSTIEVGRLNGSGTLNLPLSQGGINVSGVSTLSSNVSVGGTISVDGGVTLATNNVTIVGTSATAGEIKRIGGAPFFYDGNAWREFVLSSGTPVTQPADTEWDNVVFRATFDDDFTDAKFGATPVYIGAGASIVGAAVTIGTGAYRNIGGNVIGAGVSYAYRSEYDFTGSWTIEFWIYHDTMPQAYESFISQFTTADVNSEWSFGIYNSGSSIFWLWSNENAVSNQTLYTVSFSTFNNLFLDKWNHYALVRESNNGSIHFYINGIESGSTVNNAIIDNDILHVNGAGLYIGAGSSTNGIPFINGINWNNTYSIDAIFDDMRISAGVGTAGQRYTSIGINTSPTFTPPTTQLPITGTLTSVVNPPGDKYGEITLGGSPTWRGTSGVTVTQQSSGNYRVSFASSYTNSNDYYVLSQGMDQGFASYVGIARSTTHVDLSINRQSNDTAVDTGSLAVQIKNHI
jgi:hypothetical protein